MSVPRFDIDSFATRIRVPTASQLRIRRCLRRVGISNIFGKGTLFEFSRTFQMIGNARP
jgi:hypothetical protein